MVECHHVPPVSLLVGTRVSMESSVQRTCSTCSSVVGAVTGLAQVSPQALGVGLVRKKILSCRTTLIAKFCLAVFTFGSNGFRTQTFTRGGGATADNTAEPRSLLVQLLPLLLLFSFSILSSLPNLFSTPPVPDPRFAFASTTRYNTEMETGGLGIQYFVNPTEFSNHPVLGAELAKEGVKLGRVIDEIIPPSETEQTTREAQKEGKGSKPKTRKVVRGKGKKRGAALKKFEDTVDRVYTQDLYNQCRQGMDRKERAKEAEVGIFGIGTDWEKVKRIDNELIGSCEELKKLGLYQR